MKIIDNVYCYNISADHWTVLPQPGHRFGVLHMLDDRLSIFGGSDPVTRTSFNKVTTYNNDTNSWCSQYPDMLNKRFQPGVITYHNCVIVMGGGSSPGTIHDSIEVMEYHNQLQWKEVPVHLPVPMLAIKPTILGENIVIVGHSGGVFSRSHYQIAANEVISSLDQPLSTDTVSTKWKKMFAATHFNTATVPYSDPLVIVGGKTITTEKSVYTWDVKLYDVSKNSWSKVDSLTTARGHVGTALINKNTIIVIGGSTKGRSVESAEESSITTVEIGSIVLNH